MDKELKSALKNMEERIDKRFDSIESRMATKEDISSIQSRMATKDDISEILNVVRDVSSNTGRMIEKLQDDVTSQGQQLGHLAKRVDYIEEKTLK